MAKRTLGLLLLGSLVVAALLLFQPSTKYSRDVDDVQPSTAPLPDSSAPAPDPAQPTKNTQTTGAGSEPPPRLATREPPTPGQMVGTPPAEQVTVPIAPSVTAVSSTQPGPASGHEPQPQAEVWSYPPLLQQTASNKFVRTMDKMRNATSELERYLALGDAAKADFIFGRLEEARNYATELLSLDDKFKAEPWRQGGAVYDGNLVLGRIAAQEGRIDDAKRYLLGAGESTGSPMLGSFGPNMGLAKDLLERGEPDTVLEYFELCRKFWLVGNDKLTQWSEDVKAGRMPDFGANLYY